MQKKKLRIAIIDAMKTHGGQEKYAIDLTKSLNRDEKFHSKLFHGSKSFNKKILPKESKFISFSRFGLIRFIFSIAKIRKEFDIFHFNGDRAGLFGAICSRIGLIKYKIWSPHIPFEEVLTDFNIIKAYFYRILYSWVVKSFNQLITMSDYHKNTLISNWGVGKDFIKVIYIGIDFLKVINNKHKSGIITLGTLSRIDLNHKGLDLLVDTVGENKSEFSQVKIVIAGKGPDISQLKKLIQSSSLANNIELAGYIPHISSFFAEIDIFVLPSHRENLPLTLIEATANQTPVVSANVGGVREIIENGVNGYLFKANDKKDFKKKLLMAINNHDLLRPGIQKLYEVNKIKFSKENYIFNHMSLYRQLLS